MTGRAGSPETVGARVPQLSLPDTAGAPVPLVADGVATLLVFLPWAFSPVCTTEVRALRGVAPDVAAASTRTLAVSCDAVATLAAWREREELSFELASDFWPHGAAATAFGVFDDVLGVARRASFLLDGGGRVRWTASAPAGGARDMGAHLDAVRDLAGATS